MAIPALDAWPSAAPPAPRPSATPAIARTELELLLDCVSDGMIVVDQHARLLHANRPARELLGRVRDAARAGGALAFKDGPTQQAFERALGRCGTRWDDEPGTLRQFLVRDASGATVARASVEPLPRGRPGTGFASHLVALHRQPEASAVSTDALRAHYGLTAAEARIATAALDAHSVDHLAQRVGLSRNTVKTHLKNVFRKCEVASFAQLAALVATGPRQRGARR